MTALSIENVMGAINDLRSEMQSEIAGLKSELEEIRLRQTALGADEQGVSQEALVIMAAVVSSYLGKKVRIRSARSAQASAGPSSTWAQQGRIISHTSHNLRRTR